MAQELTQARLKELLHYDPETGVFTWTGGNKHPAGSVACITPSVRIDNARYSAGRLAVLYVDGYLPDRNRVKHKNLDVSDSRYSNIFIPTPKIGIKTQSELKSLVSYNHVTGQFTWVSPISNAVKVGDTAGGINPTTGYIHIRLKGKTYAASRLAWLYFHGEWPDFEVDHFDRVKTNNKISNLRPATRSENMQNTGRKPGASGFRGVYGRGNCWLAFIQINGKQTLLGSYKTPDEANVVRRLAVENLYSHGRVHNE